MNGSSNSGRSNQRLTVRMGDDAVAPAHSTIAATGAGVALENPVNRKPGHGGDDSRHFPAIRPARDRADGGGAKNDRRGRSGLHNAAVADDVVARRLGIHLVQRLGRQHDRRRPRIRAEHLRQHAGK